MFAVLGVSLATQPFRYISKHAHSHIPSSSMCQGRSLGHEACCEEPDMLLMKCVVL